MRVPGWPLLAVVLVGCMPPSWGANALLHPGRRAVPAMPEGARAVSARNGDVTLDGWFFPATGERRGVLLYLHGVSDNRASGVGIARRYGPSGWDVATFDQRAHGSSGGSSCTYGFFEKTDVSRMLDALGAERAVVFGSSLGASVALEAAAVDARIVAVIAQSPFASLRRIASERAPFFASDRNVEEAFRLAEQASGMRVDDVSAEKAAAQISVPVLLIHGADDAETSCEHSRAIDRALRGPHRLLVVDDAGHNDVLAREEVWTEISSFLAAQLGR